MDSTIFLVTSLSAYKKVQREKEKEGTSKFVDSLHLKKHEQNLKFLESTKDAQHFRCCVLSSRTSLFSVVHLGADSASLDLH